VKQLSDENKAKSEEIQSVSTRLNEATIEWNARIEQERLTVAAQYEALISTVKEKNRELRSLCAKMDESILNTERHNRDLIRRIGCLEREIEQKSQDLTAAKEELVREKHLLDTKSKAAGLRTEMKYQAEIDDLKANFAVEMRRLCGFAGQQFPHLFDVRHSFDPCSFKDIIEKAAREMTKLKETDAALRRLLCLSAEESTENAVSKLLLSLYQQ
jgi:YesN/AraC family two-component response regulator